MLATILKVERAVLTTLAIIETFAKVRSMVRDMERLQTLKDGSNDRAQSCRSQDYARGHASERR